tara:strand:- start:49 stop:630 length:582 start_codon:yes stop_codon:yes gene_type:complete
VWLEKATNSLLNRQPKPKGTDAPSDADPYFYGLSDEALWRALAGDYQSGLGELELDEVRPRFAMALGKAAVRLIKEAPSASDISLGSVKTGSIKNSLDVFTLRGRVTVWLPPQHAAALAELGSKINATPAQIESQAGAQLLHDILGKLYSEAGLERDPEAFSEIRSEIFPDPRTNQSPVDESGSEKDDASSQS